MRGMLLIAAVAAVAELAFWPPWAGGGMFLTGIKRLFPAVYDAIPDDMGCQAFGCILHTMLLCGIDTTGE